MNDIDIRKTKPNISCKYCRVRKFADTNNKYAECTNSNMLDKLMHITVATIKAKGDIMPSRISCYKCKGYIDGSQLALFYE